MPSGKSPGSDGFNADFYKFFWDDICDLIIGSFTSSFENSLLSIDQRRGILSLNPKKDKDIRRIKNWRPITLLNTDYKIIAKLLGIRLQTVLPKLIHSDQVAYLKNRYIGQNIRIIDDVINFTHATNSQAIIACIDFEKAFDSVEWHFVEKTLAAFNFGPDFIKWFSIMYGKTSSCVVNNGYASQFFTITRGIRQGCPLSAYLFLLVVELLAISIRQNKNIHGIKIGEKELIIAQMADDTTIFPDGPVSLQRCLLTFSIFGVISGLIINIVKSEAMCVGAFNKLSDKKPYGLAWRTEKLVSLGIHFYKNPDLTIEKNLQMRLTKFENLLNMWKQRCMSIKGKITIIKNLALPQLLYATSNLAVPEWFIKKVNSTMFKFLWSANMDKVKRATIIGRTADGGLKMVDIEAMIKAQKVMWIKRLFLADDNASWTLYPKLLCKHTGIPLYDLLKCNLDPHYLPENMPLFYHQMLHSWYGLKDQIPPPKYALDIRKQFYLYNKCILINNRYASRQYSRWHLCGIKLIHDLFDCNGNLYTAIQLETIYSIRIDIMLHNSLTAAIPQPWKRAIHNIPVYKNAINAEETPNISISDREFNIQLIKNRTVYWAFVKTKFCPPVSLAAWEHMYQIDQSEWKNLYDTLYCLMCDANSITQLQNYIAHSTLQLVCFKI